MFGVELHLLIIHFPIALVIVTLGYDGWAIYSRRPRLHKVSSGLTMIGALSAIVATATGLSLAGMRGLGSGGTVTGHAGFALAGTIVLSALAFVRYSAETRAGSEDTTFSSLWLMAEILAVGLIGAAAIIGHGI